MTVVLASHLPDAGHFHSERFEVHPIECVEPEDYRNGVAAWWESNRTICNVEHDMEVSDDLIAALLDCPHPLCVYAYLLHFASTGGAAHYAQRDGGPGHGEWIEPGIEWCGFTGIGFCKITPAARVRPLGERGWQEVDCAVSEATDGDWHVHWPAVAHHHH